MPYNSNERLEREARESLVAADLSAKMKQWREQSPPPKGGGGSPLRFLLLLLAMTGIAWLFWPKTQKSQVVPPVQPSGLPPATETQKPLDNVPNKQEPVAQKQNSSPNRYLALAQSSYRAPDFASDIRGAESEGQNLLNEARRMLVQRRYTDAMHVLQNAPEAYQTDAAYLRGHALFGLKSYPQAAAVFGNLTGSVRYGEAAQWYEILALLPEYEHHKSLVLNKIKKVESDKGHTFQGEAKALLKGL